MSDGMLWSDTSRSSFWKKLRDAVGHFQDTKGGKPTRCYVNPDTMSTDRCDQANKLGVALNQDRYVPPHELRLH